MLSLILLLAVGAGIAFLALQNTELVSLTFLDYTVTNVPLYAVIIGSLFAGVSLAYVIYLVHSFSTAMKIRSQRKKIEQKKEEVVELTKKVHQLELDNEGLKKAHTPEVIDPRAL